MKTDRILTLAEYLDQWCGIPTRVIPPASDARHVPITPERDIDVRTEKHDCRCDRWGHPCPGCVERRSPQPGNESDEAFLLNK